MIRSVAIVPTIVAIDQLIKYLMRTHPAWQGAFFRISENTGLLFDIPAPPLPTLVVTGGILLFLGAFALHAARREHTRMFLSMLWMLGGGVSNWIDRWRFGAVTDIFQGPFGFLFNLADVAIIFGIILLLWRPHTFLPHRS